MSQKATRKSAVSEEKDKRQADSPVKEMKKKMAANAEKEKHAADKSTEKVADKTEKPKPVEKSAEKKDDKKQDKGEKNGPVAEKEKDNKEKENKIESKEKKDAEKKDDKEDSKADNKAEKNVKPKETKASKQNGSKHNGETNGEALTISDEDDALVIDDEDPRDEMFPELAYEESDGDFEPSDGAPSRSFTRRSQVKAARTPETPRPASDKQPEQPAMDDSKDSKLLKMSEAPPSDRKLRSADSPKPESKKKEKETDSPKKQESEKEKADKGKDEKGQEETKEKDESKSDEAKENGEKDKLEMDVTVEIEHEESERRKAGTNFAKSRVKVSPYRRSARLADHTTASTQANYTGNNSTMEMDITESSSLWESSLEDSYLVGLRAIRGRRSYKALGEMPPRRAAPRGGATLAAAESSNRPTGTVVGRKRKPEEGSCSGIEVASEAGEGLSKRVRLLERIAQPFRRTTTSTPLPARRAAEIVGINTDLPLSAPVASPDTFDPESLKATSTPSVPLAPAAAPLPERDAKRCVVM